jgi:hypothetical protein
MPQAIALAKITLSMSAPPLIRLPAPSPRERGEGDGRSLGAIPTTLAMGETIDDSVLLPVPIV